MTPIRLSAADRERYGGPEWLDTDAAIGWLLEIPFPEQVAIERQMRAVMGINLLYFITFEQGELSMANLVLRAWLALRQAGVDVALADFGPDWLRIDWAKSSPDAGPPSGGADSSPSPDSTATGSPTRNRTSPRRTASSTRGSGKTSK